MTDIAKLVFSDWEMAVIKYQRGQLQKPDVTKLLRAGEPIPAEAQAMIADILENDGKALKQGAPRRKWSPVSKIMAVHMVTLAEGYINDPGTLPDDCDPHVRADFHRMHRQTTYKRRKRATARQQAKAMVADDYSISVRTLETWIKDYPQ